MFFKLQVLGIGKCDADAMVVAVCYIRAGERWDHFSMLLYNVFFFLLLCSSIYVYNCIYVYILYSVGMEDYISVRVI